MLRFFDHLIHSAFQDEIRKVFFVLCARANQLVCAILKRFFLRLYLSSLFFFSLLFNDPFLRFLCMCIEIFLYISQCCLPFSRLKRLCDCLLFELFERVLKDGVILVALCKGIDFHDGLLRFFANDREFLLSFFLFLCSFFCHSSKCISLCFQIRDFVSPPRRFFFLRFSRLFFEVCTILLELIIIWILLDEIIKA